MKKYFYVILCGFALAFGTQVAPAISATVSRLITTGTASATATSTLAFMTPGTGTTTVSMNIDQSEQAAVLVVLQASTTNTVLGLQWQYSNDQIDWYDEDLVPSTVNMSQSIIEHASTTVSHRVAMGSTLASTTKRIISVPILPARYVRAIFSIPAGSQNGALWAQPVKAINY